MTESGLELAESVLEVALHFAKRSSEGGCGGEDRPINLRGVGGILGFFFFFRLCWALFSIIFLLIFRVVFLIVFGSFWGAKMEPFWSPKSIKMRLMSF